MMEISSLWVMIIAEVLVVLILTVAGLLLNGILQYHGLFLIFI